MNWDFMDTLLVSSFSKKLPHDRYFLLALNITLHRWLLQNNQPISLICFPYSTELGDSGSPGCDQCRVVGTTSKLRTSRLTNCKVDTASTSQFKTYRLLWLLALKFQKYFPFIRTPSWSINNTITTSTNYNLGTILRYEKERSDWLLNGAVPGGWMAGGGPDNATWDSGCARVQPGVTGCRLAGTSRYCWYLRCIGSCILVSCFAMESSSQGFSQVSTPQEIFHVLIPRSIFAQEPTDVSWDHGTRGDRAGAVYDCYNCVSYLS